MRSSLILLWLLGQQAFHLTVQRAERYAIRLVVLIASLFAALLVAAGIYAAINPNQAQVYCAGALIWAGITIAMQVYRMQQFLSAVQDLRRDVNTIIDPLGH